MDQGTGGSDVEQNKALAIIGYIGILFLVPMLAAPKSPFAQFHARQGMVLFIAEIILFVVISILSFVTLGLGAVLYPIVSIIGIIWSVLGIVNAAQGASKELPIIGKFAGKFKV